MDFSSLNESQKKAVTFEGKHLLVLAGAGTGKTKTIISRASYLIACGIDPSKIQILTFTKKAASEIVSRVKSSLYQGQVKALKGSTFHSWCNQLLTRYPSIFGLKKFTIIDEDDQLSLIKIVCGNKNVEFEGSRIKPGDLLDLYSFGRNTKRNLSETIRCKLFNNSNEKEAEEKIISLKSKLEIILLSYERKKRERAYLDYDDILQIVANRLKIDDQAKILIGSQYEYILIDEMQDTNPLQWELLEPLQNICNLFCVGDDAQSIYSFRGADFKNVYLFGERVKNSEVCRLEDNYRSTQEILDLSNWLLEKSQINYNKRLRAVRGKGVIPEILNVTNEWEEANWVADKIIDNFTKNNKCYNDHLVLARYQSLTKKIQAVFIERKIPYVTYGGKKFMESAHIKDVMSVLRVVNNIYDEIAWMRFLTIWAGIGEVKASRCINELLSLSDIHECIECMKVVKFDDGNPTISNILEAVEEGKLNVSKALTGAFKLMEERLSINYKEDWETKRRPDFEVLEVLANSYSTLGDFINESILDSSININSSPTLNQSRIDKYEGKDQVIISTIHSAKGLEADVCFVLNVTPSIYPSSRSIGDLDKIEEDRRLLYVALTRAKNHLYITRNKNSIYAEPKITEMNYETKTDEGKTIEERYFFNGLPDKLVTQESVNLSIAKISEPKSHGLINIEYGMDFN